MKVIHVPEGITIEAFDGPTETITPASAEVIMAPVLTNKLKIISCAYEIEKLLEGLITNHFFGFGSPTLRADFQNQILGSSWCSFESKRKLALHIVTQKNLLSPTGRNNFEKLLRRTISFRNAFTHGSLSTDGRRVRLSYFEGEQRSDFLTEEWLTKIENVLGECFQIAFSLMERVHQVVPSTTPEHGC